MKIKKAEIKSFNAANYTATVRLADGYKVYLEDVTVARNIASGEMVAGRKAAVVFFDENNPKEAVVTAVYT
ncbi:MAG: hypothetical protein A2Z15_05360 [Chloroflexi bacterium RBG_16_50_11]|nr:MAG: hypothetical protein A2Z15_05360 [Chloroflexi bacterium RBG_16_50_11]